MPLSREPDGAAPSTEPVVELREVVVGYGGTPVVTGVDFTLRRGDACALLGPNGCGKTTLIKGILGLARVSQGEVRLFGVPAGSFRERYRFGYVPQRLVTGSGLPITVTETVAAGRLARMRRLRPMRGADHEAVQSALDLVGLSGYGRRRMSELSGGQQRRAIIARALAGQPDVLVMDEPMAGVDLEHQGIIADTLGRLVDGGRTVLVVMHELGPLVSTITRVVAMQGGRMAYDGPTRSVDVHQHGSEDHLHGADAPGPRLTWRTPTMLGE